MSLEAVHDGLFDWHCYYERRQGRRRSAGPAHASAFDAITRHPLCLEPVQEPFVSLYCHCDFKVGRRRSADLADASAITNRSRHPIQLDAVHGALLRQCHCASPRRANSRRKRGRHFYECCVSVLRNIPGYHPQAIESTSSSAQASQDPAAKRRTGAYFQTYCRDLLCEIPEYRQVASRPRIAASRAPRTMLAKHSALLCFKWERKTMAQIGNGEC